jgi:hypothetical protein
MLIFLILVKLKNMEKNSKPLKKSLTGMEVEFATLNDKGQMVFRAGEIIDTVKKKDKHTGITGDCGENMIEVQSFPSTRVSNTAFNLLENIKRVLEVAKKKQVVIFPCGTYPGRFIPRIRKKDWYQAKSQVIGNDRFLTAGMCFGYHNHYTLPKSVFDNKTKFLKNLVNSKLKESLISSYNLSIAMDPVMLVFLQSSPFVQGKYLAKDSRAVIYRGGDAFNYQKGLYSDFQYFGALPKYKHTLSDLMVTLKTRQRLWIKKMKISGLNPELILKDTSILDFSWNPVKINKLGTLEQRSMDSNHPKNIIAASMLIKFVLREVQRRFLKVMPSDIGAKEPFKIEGDTLHIPPYSLIKKHEVRAAYDGLENIEVSNLCSRFIKLAKSCMGDNYDKILNPLFVMVKKKETVADKIIKRFKHKGYGLEDTIPDKICAEEALRSSSQLLSEIEKTQALIKDL